VKAVTLILKHATLLRISNLPEAALTNADLDYQRQNIDNSLDNSIQQCLESYALNLSVEQFAGFIMGTEIGWFILLFVTSISYCPFSVISVLSPEPLQMYCYVSSLKWPSHQL
jgi:hypothetical protein